MELVFHNDIQYKIADILWKLETLDEVQKVIDEFGHDAQVVFEMMIAASVDDSVDDVTQAKQIISSIMRKS